MRLAALAGAAAPAMAASAAASAAIARRREGTLARTFSPSACSLSLAPCTARIPTWLHVEAGHSAAWQLV